MLAGFSYAQSWYSTVSPFCPENSGANHHLLVINVACPFRFIFANGRDMVASLRTVRVTNNAHANLHPSDAVIEGLQEMSTTGIQFTFPRSAPPQLPVSYHSFPKLGGDSTGSNV